MECCKHLPSPLVHRFYSVLIFVCWFLSTWFMSLWQWGIKQLHHNCINSYLIFPVRSCLSDTVMCSAWSFIPGLDICYFSAIGITSSVVEDKCIVQFNEIFINRLSYKLFKSWYAMNYKPQRREELIVQIKTHYFLVTTALEYYNLKIHTLGCSWNSKLGEHLGTTHPLLYYFWEQVSMLPHQTFMGFW